MEPVIKNVKLSYDAYLELREKSDNILEYIDGIVYMSPSPSTRHQRISSKLHAKLYNILEGKSCEVFHAPFDILLKNEDIEGEKLVIPDLSVICDKSGFTDNKYIGVPSLIIEILSPSNQSHDLVTKLNIYMKYGVKEYWIVNPILNTVMLYTLNQDRMYEQSIVKTETGIVKSKLFEEFEVDIEDLFS
ncbi:Uma2 family endonuclease [Clostridium beijerinckii]|uniref:Uma2 family endonuclease n=1 Tax=Clostridium beijerinckii TaxID=1520 RepID=UPI0002EBF346|nr:Uma2 family endonuclease [Clostridium beijerinckii]